MTTIIEDKNVQLLTFPDVDNFLAILEINDADAATEYRFEKAVPTNHTAILQPDGSVQFIDSKGKESGGIAAPWALDANGSPVSTRYEIGGNVLVQIIEHTGAYYPVIADPWWTVVIPVVVYVDRCLKLHCITVAVGAAAAIEKVVNYVSSLEAPRERSRVHNTCHMRNRSGC